ncbi:hypothetical protein D3C87_727270 [compost metagenome]
MSMPTCNVPFLVLHVIRPIPLAAAEHALYQKITCCVCPMPIMHRQLRRIYAAPDETRKNESRLPNTFSIRPMMTNAAPTTSKTVICSAKAR